MKHIEKKLDRKCSKMLRVVLKAALFQTVAVWLLTSRLTNYQSKTGLILSTAEKDGTNFNQFSPM